MCPRRNRPRGGGSGGSGSGGGGGPDDAERRPVGGWATERRDEWRGEEWSVRQITGAAATKHYRCPGCDQEIPPGVPHVVAWPRLGAVDDRRHWHRACWGARERRAPRR